MRQQRWLELVKDYDCEIIYHQGKANRVANALNQKSATNVMSIQAMLEMLHWDIQKLELEIIRGQISALTLQLTILDGIKGSQELDPLLTKLKEQVQQGKNVEFSVSLDNILHFKGRLCHLIILNQMNKSFPRHVEHFWIFFNVKYSRYLIEMK